jgi:hypothetical protein
MVRRAVIVIVMAAMAILTVGAVAAQAATYHP